MSEPFPPKSFEPEFSDFFDECSESRDPVALLPSALVATPRWVGQATPVDPGVGMTGSWPRLEAGGRLAAVPLLVVASKQTDPWDMDGGHWICISIWAWRTG